VLVSPEKVLAVEALQLEAGKQHAVGGARRPITDAISAAATSGDLSGTRARARRGRRSPAGLGSRRWRRTAFSGNDLFGSGAGVEGEYSGFAPGDKAVKRFVLSDGHEP
jgi:hypothetical protein